MVGSVHPSFMVGPIPVYGDLILSPMAGFSDKPYRLICREYDSDAYTDTSDTLPARDPLLTRTQALKRASVIPKGAGSLTIVEVEV